MLAGESPIDIHEAFILISETAIVPHRTRNTDRLSTGELRSAVHGQTPIEFWIGSIARDRYHCS